MTNDLLKIVPSKLPKPANHQHGKTYFAKGDFYYYHYACDKANDIVSMMSVGLQTLISFINPILIFLLIS